MALGDRVAQSLGREFASRQVACRALTAGAANDPYTSVAATSIESPTSSARLALAAEDIAPTDLFLAYFPLDAPGTTVVYPAVRPMSTLISPPVMYRVSSDARKRTTPATSSGSIQATGIGLSDCMTSSAASRVGFCGLMSP